MGVSALKKWPPPPGSAAYVILIKHSFKCIDQIED